MEIQNLLASWGLFTAGIAAMVAATRWEITKFTFWTRSALITIRLCFMLMGTGAFLFCFQMMIPELKEIELVLLTTVVAQLVLAMLFPIKKG